MPEPTPRRHRRWFSLSLRGMMLLILVVGGFMGWKARRASLQRRAVARIERLQGDVVYDWQARDPYTPAVTFEPPGPVWLRKMLGDEYFQEVVTVTIPGFRQNPLPLPPSQGEPRDGPQWKALDEHVRRNLETEDALARDELACLEGLDRIERLRLYRPPLNSAGLARLGRLTSLKELVIVWPLNDEGLAQVARLSNLESLAVHLDLEDDSTLSLLERLPRLKYLSLVALDPRPYSITSDHTRPVHRLTDASFARLGKLRQINFLSLEGLELTDAGLAHLKGLTHLEVFRIEGPTRITDVGLGHLKEIDTLVHLDLLSTNGITDAGVEQLVKMPQLVGLSLNIESVTDVGLSRLKSLTKLKILNPYGRKVKGEIIDEIQAAIPRVLIEAERIDEPTTANPSASDAVTPPTPAAPRN